VANLQQISELEEKLSQICWTESGQPGNSYDEVFSLADVNLANLATIARLRPFGKDFEKPVFLFKGLKVIQSRRFGQNRSHLAISLSDGEFQSLAVSFFEKKDSFAEPLDILAHLEKDWQGKPRLRIIKQGRAL